MINDLHRNDLKNVASHLVLRSSNTLDTIVMARDAVGNRRGEMYLDGPMAQNKTFFSSFFDPVEPDTVVSNGIAIIRVNGMIRPETPWWASTSGVEDLITEVIRLKDDVNTSRTVIRITSCGGFPERLEDWRAAVAEHSKEKPIDAFITDVGLSGGFWLAAPCDTIWCDPIAQVGALGVFSILCDRSKLWDEIGILCTLVNDNPEGVKGHSSVPEVSKRLIEETLRSLMETSALFRAAVKEGRDFSDDQIKNLFTGQTWTGEAALDLGLVDGVKPWFQYLAALTSGDLSTLSEDNSNGKEDEMPNNKTEPDEEQKTAAWNFLSQLTGGRFGTGSGSRTPPRRVAETGVPDEKPTQTAVVGRDKYMDRAAIGEMRAFVSGKLSETKLTPGVLKTPGFSNALCFNLSLSILGDRERQDETLVAACPTMYDVAEACVWDNARMLSTVINMFEVTDPFGALMQAFGAVPQFIAATEPNLFSNFVRHDQKETDAAPRGGNVDTPTAPGNGGFSDMSTNAQEVLTELTDGKIKDDATYKERTSGLG